MIIPDSFNQSYEATRNRWIPVKAEVDGVFSNTLIPLLLGSTYSSRIKGIESAYLKAQKENYHAPLEEMNDLFACQVVVLTLSDVKKVIQQVGSIFVCEQPKSDLLEPTSFGYNDVHLLLQLRDTPLRMDKSVLELKFELQIKTFLQSAWQNTGHNIIYKSSVASYWNERIFGQVRALLELADNILAQIDQASKILSDNSLYSADAYKINQTRITRIMEIYFARIDLPADRRRMAFIIQKYLDIAGVSLDEFETLLNDAKNESHQVFEYLTLSPADKVFVLLYERYRDKMLKRLNSKSNKNRALITPEMESFFPSLKSIGETGRCRI